MLTLVHEWTRQANIFKLSKKKLIYTRFNLIAYGINQPNIFVAMEFDSSFMGDPMRSLTMLWHVIRGCSCWFEVQIMHCSHEFFYHVSFVGPLLALPHYLKFAQRSSCCVHQTNKLRENPSSSNAYIKSSHLKSQNQHMHADEIFWWLGKMVAANGTLLISPKRHTTLAAT